LVPLFLTSFASAESTDDFNLSAVMQGVSEDNLFYDEEFFNWGSGIVKGDDGKYHLIYSQMPREHSFFSWLTDGIVSRAVSDNPMGPYRHVEVVLEGRGEGYWDAYTAHCPKVYKFDGKYYIYYMATNTGDLKLTPEQLEEARRGKWDESEMRAMMRLNQRIGVAVTDSIEGPW
ncbi:glycoside hydrolase family protein, partial [Opitutaceae bacterium]|nr:glycoside hydrolase family protein [Opitutaceae bacterium]